MSSSDGEMFSPASVRTEEEENTTVENVDILSDSSEEQMNLTLDTLHLNTSVENVDILPSEEKMNMTLETLHEDGIEHVIKKLVPQDLCYLSQTSTSIKAKTSRPEFWQLINVSQRKIKQEGLSKLFIIEKFKLVQRIDLSYMDFTDQELISNLHAVAASSVVELDLEGVNKVPTKLLASVASRLKKINLSCSDPTKEQLVAVLETCVPLTAMTRLNWQRYHNLRGLPVDLLTRAYGKLRQLTHVNLEYCTNLQKVPVDLLVKALGNLIQINLNNTDLTQQQNLAVVKMCASSPSMMELSLCGADLADVPPQTLGQAAGSLSKIELGRCRLTRDQIISVLDACSASSTLNHVDMRCNNLQEVPAEQLAKAVGNLQSVDLAYTRLTTEQCIAVLEKCKSSSSKLTDIDLSRVDLSQVTPHLLEEAIPHLQRMGLIHAKVTAEQRIGILNAVLTSNTIVHMYFRGEEKASLPDGLFIQAEQTGRLEEF